MSQFHDRFTNHDIHKTLDALSTLIDGLDDLHDKPEHQELIDRLRQVVDYGLGRLKMVDAELVSEALLHNAKNQAEMVNPQVA